MSCSCFDLNVVHLQISLMSLNCFQTCTDFISIISTCCRFGLQTCTGDCSFYFDREFPFKLVGGRVPFYVRRVKGFLLSHGVLD